MSFIGYLALLFWNHTSTCLAVMLNFLDRASFCFCIITKIPSLYISLRSFSNTINFSYEINLRDWECCVLWKSLPEKQTDPWIIGASSSTFRLQRLLLRRFLLSHSSSRRLWCSRSYCWEKKLLLPPRNPPLMEECSLVFCEDLQRAKQNK